MLIVEISQQSSAKLRCFCVQRKRLAFLERCFFGWHHEKHDWRLRDGSLPFFASKFHTTNNGLIPQRRHEVWFCIKKSKFIFYKSHLFVHICSVQICRVFSTKLKNQLPNEKQMSETKVSIGLAIVWSSASDSASSSLTYYCFQFHAKHTHTHIHGME